MDSQFAQSRELQHLVDPNSKKGEGKLIGIWEALRRAQDARYLPWANCIPLTISQEEDEAIRKIINEFRNEFEHFTPKSWTIEISGMPQILRQVFRVIGFLALESNCITYFEADQKLGVENALSRIQKILDAVPQP